MAIDYALELEATPSEEQVNNILADLTRVFVVEIRHQVLHSSGTAIAETVTFLLKWKLPKSIMVKLMKICHMWCNDTMESVASRLICDCYLNNPVALADLGVDGLLDSINTLLLWFATTATTTTVEGMVNERNWEPGKVLPKNEMYIMFRTQGPGTESVAAALTQIVHVHYQIFKFTNTESDALMWEQATNT